MSNGYIYTVWYFGPNATFDSSIPWMAISSSRREKKKWQRKAKYSIAETEIELKPNWTYGKLFLAPFHISQDRMNTRKNEKKSKWSTCLDSICRIDRPHLLWASNCGCIARSAGEIIKLNWMSWKSIIMRWPKVDWPDIEFSIVHVLLDECYMTLPLLHILPYILQI